MFAKIIILDEVCFLLLEPPNKTCDSIPIRSFEYKLSTADGRSYFVEGSLHVCSVYADSRKFEIVSIKIKLHEILR